MKALPWFRDVRVKLQDPRYSGWFLHRKDNASALYYDTGQTTPGDCGVACGEYLYDHRNESLRKFIVDVVVGGSDAMASPYVDGLFLDGKTEMLPLSRLIE